MCRMNILYLVGLGSLAITSNPAIEDHSYIQSKRKHKHIRSIVFYEERPRESRGSATSHKGEPAGAHSASRRKKVRASGRMQCTTTRPTCTTNQWPSSRPSFLIGRTGPRTRAFPCATRTHECVLTKHERRIERTTGLPARRSHLIKSPAT